MPAAPATSTRGWARSARWRTPPPATRFSRPAALHDRRAFVRFYTDFYFTRRCGHLPEAGAYVDPTLLHLLNRLHTLAADGDRLPAVERWAIFSTACTIYGQARVAVPAR